MPLHPRLDNQGRPLTEYVYRVPDKTGDGWETTSLLDAGIDVNARDRDGATALHIAAAMRNATEAVGVLLAHDADNTVVDHQGQTAIDVAASDEIRQLIEEGMVK